MVETPKLRLVTVERRGSEFDLPPVLDRIDLQTHRRPDMGLALTQLLLERGTDFCDDRVLLLSALFAPSQRPAEPQNRTYRYRCQKGCLGFRSPLLLALPILRQCPALV